MHRSLQLQDQMAWRSHGRSNAELVEKLCSHKIIRSQRVRDAMLAVDRAEFVLPSDAAVGYMDTPQPIGHGATISAPHMHASCAELLQDVLRPGARVLDVGSGSGYLAVVLAQMVAPGGKVFGVDYIPELVAFSKRNVQKSHSGLLNDGALELIVGDGWRGYAPGAPYDAIHVGAAAATVPQALLDQLRPGGKLVLPVGKWAQELELITKDEQGGLHRKSLMAVQYVPLVKQQPDSDYAQPEQAHGSSGTAPSVKHSGGAGGSSSAAMR